MSNFKMGDWVMVSESNDDSDIRGKRCLVTGFSDYDLTFTVSPFDGRCAGTAVLGELTLAPSDQAPQQDDDPFLAYARKILNHPEYCGAFPTAIRSILAEAYGLVDEVHTVIVFKKTETQA